MALLLSVAGRICSIIAAASTPVSMPSSALSEMGATKLRSYVSKTGYRPSRGRTRRLWSVTPRTAPAPVARNCRQCSRSSLRRPPRHREEPHIVAEAFRKLPGRWGARLVLLGEGPLREEIASLGVRASTPRLCSRPAATRAVARKRTCTSRAWPTRRVGVSIVEAQAPASVSALPPAAMVERVTTRSARLGPVDDARRCGDILAVLNSDLGHMAQSRRPKLASSAGTAA